jgi:hypothetical protein
LQVPVDHQQAVVGRFEGRTAAVSLSYRGSVIAPDIISVEAGAPPGQERTTTGVDACKQKGAMFRTRMEIMSINVEGPFPHDDRFAIFIAYDGTAKLGPTAGQRQLMKEVALYTVAKARSCEKSSSIR